MDVIIMPSTISTISKILNNYPQFLFKESSDFSWSPSDNTIRYNPIDTNSASLLMHEIAHALLGHEQYKSDVKLLKIEQEAWDYAIKLAQALNITIPDQIVQSNLDTYRDWLHARSKCPECSSNGLQIKPVIYSCPVCSNKWQVNQARTCNLRRTKINK